MTSFEENFINVFGKERFDEILGIMVSTSFDEKKREFWERVFCKTLKFNQALSLEEIVKIADFSADEWAKRFS